MSESPVAWFNLAHAYLQDAAILEFTSKPSGGFYGEPVRFLYFHSIELFLKTYLRLQGMEEDEISKRPYGHDLAKLADEAERRGLMITKQVRLVCDAARAFDKPMETRYIKTGRKTYLPAHKLHETARDLQSRVGEALRANGIWFQRFPPLPVVHPPRPLTRAKAVKQLARFLMIFCICFLSSSAIAAEKKSNFPQRKRINFQGQHKNLPSVLAYTIWLQIFMK